MTNVVEGPGNTCIEKLVRREKLDNAERTTLSFYMLIMATRGPRQRKKSRNLVPAVLKNVVGDTRKEIEEWIQENPEDAEVARAQLKELDAVQERYSKEIPQQILDQICTPFWSEKTLECIHNMAWHILPAPPSMYFVTCDTPAHFFEGFGLGTPDSEFTFSISKSLRANWGTPPLMGNDI